MLAMQPGCTEALAAGRARFAAGEYAAAAEAFRVGAQTCQPALRGELLLARGQALLLAGEPDGAERAMRDAVAAGGSVAARYALGRMMADGGRYKEAAAELEQVVRQEPGHFRAQDSLGFCYDAMGEDARAVRHYVRALELVKDAHKEYGRAYANFAEYFLKRGDGEKAFQLAAEAAERESSVSRNFVLAGRALVMLEKLPQAEKWLRKAVELEPGFAEARFQLAQWLRRMGRDTDAEREMEAFRKLRAGK